MTLLLKSMFACILFITYPTSTPPPPPPFSSPILTLGKVGVFPSEMGEEECGSRVGSKEMGRPEVEGGMLLTGVAIRAVFG